jgi:hypothetical protein
VLTLKFSVACVHSSLIPPEAANILISQSAIRNPHLFAAKGRAMLFAVPLPWKIDELRRSKDRFHQNPASGRT